MTNEGQIDVRDPGQLRVALRADLRISIQSFQEGICYLFEDPLETRVFQVGISEGTFLSLLDGTRVLDEAIRQTTAALGENAFSEREAMAIVRWLTDAKLAYVADSSAGAVELIDADERAARRAFDPSAIRFPLVRPDALLQILLPWCGWLFAGPMFFLWCLLCTVASWRIAVNWDQFRQAALATFVPGHWWSLMAVCLVLKVLHEMAHGLVCRKYGGSVSEAGLMLLWGLPIPYVDVTSSWAFRNKNARIHTAAAGMYLETLIAAIAGLAWQHTRTDLFSQICIHVMLVVTMGSLLFNANPLMRFDGYYILMDLLGIPNLATRGYRFWATKASHFFCGIPAVMPNYTRWQRHVIAWYGLLSMLWRYLVYFTLAILIVAFLPIDEGHVPLAGLLLIAIIVAVQRIAQPSSGTLNARPNVLRLAVTGGALVTIAWFVLFHISWPRRITAPGVVEYAPLHTVRTYSPGFVREVRVRSGDVVRPGQVIVTLANPELEAELADLELAIEQSQLALRTLQHKGESAAHTAELQNLEGLRKRHAEKKIPVERLIVRAPAAGRIVSRLVELALGTYLEPGTEVVAIGEQTSKELSVSISQDDVHLFGDCVGKDTCVRVGNAVFTGRLTQISPRANVTPAHSALCASEGGPLAVRFVTLRDAGANTNQLSLRAPHFTAQVSLPADQATRLGAGQRGQIAIDASSRPLGTQLLRAIGGWCRDKVRHVRGGDGFQRGW